MRAHARETAPGDEREAPARPIGWFWSVRLTDSTRTPLEQGTCEHS